MNNKIIAGVLSLIALSSTIQGIFSSPMDLWRILAGVLIGVCAFALFAHEEDSQD